MHCRDRKPGQALLWWLALHLGAAEAASSEACSTCESPKS